MRSVKQILILIETDEGKVHQVLANPELKQLALNLLVNPDTGTLPVDTEVMPITLQPAR